MTIKKEAQAVKNTLEQVLGELQSLNKMISVIDSKVSNLEVGQQSMGADISSLKDGQLRMETRMETEIIDKIRALFDAREVQNDTNRLIVSTLRRIEEKVSTHEMAYNRIK